jgi:AbiV family abortive infection protein
MDSKWTNAIEACVRNAERLRDGVEFLRYDEHRATAFALAVLSQEESAKAFLLQLVDRGIVPWTREVARALRNHRCKHLVVLVMDWLSPALDEWLERMIGREQKIPSHVADAINILRHEKIGRWESHNWVWAEDPEYDRQASSVANGEIDDEKQDALYVRLGASGEVLREPTGMTTEALEDAIEKADRLKDLVKSCMTASHVDTLWFRYFADVTRAVFADLGRRGGEDVP